VVCLTERRIENRLRSRAGDDAVSYWAGRAANADSRAERYAATGMGFLASLCTSDTCTLPIVCFVETSEEGRVARWKDSGEEWLATRTRLTSMPKN
jgi:hypothetical protein